MNIPADLKYTKDHEWLRVQDGIGTVGITDFAQKQLGDVVFVEIPEAGKPVKQQEGLSVVESVKAVSDIFAPVSGAVVKANEALADTPELLNQDPYGDGWIAQIELADPGELAGLLTAAEYEKLAKEEK